AAELFGGEPKTFAGEVFEAVNSERLTSWRQQVKKIDWQLFDQGVDAFTWLAIEECMKSSADHVLVRTAPRGEASLRFISEAKKAQIGEDQDRTALEPYFDLKEQLQKPFAARVLFWQRQSGPKGDLVNDEMGRVLQVPGWSNIFTQPIINRIEMLSTGVRTDIGIKVFGPDLDTIERVG